MRKAVSSIILWSLLFLFNLHGFSQNNGPYTSSFIGRMGIDTVLVETYTVFNNHLYGKVFTRVPEDYIGVFNIHFYPDGSIREYNIFAMDPFNSSVPFKATSNALAYQRNMNCVNDTCTFYYSEKGKSTETKIKFSANKMDFVGGWVPLISLMEWSCMRLIKAEEKFLPLKIVNHNLGIYPIGVKYIDKENVVFGGPFLEYTKIKIDAAGRILNTNGIGTPWNYFVTKHAPINIDQIANRMAKTPGIGIPSPTETINKTVQNKKIELSYGRPFKRGRNIFGGVVPYDSVWRTGANKPTTLKLEGDIKVGKTIIPKGHYSLYTIPKPKEWLLIFNTDLNRWPTDPNRKMDFTSVTLPVTKASNPKEQFTIEIQETKKGGVLQFQWDDVIATMDFLVIK